MFRKFQERLSVLSWHMIAAVVVFIVSAVYMVLGLIALAIYFVLASLFFVALSFRE